MSYQNIDTSLSYSLANDADAEKDYWLEHEDEETQPISVHFDPIEWQGKSNSYALADYEISVDELRGYARQVIELRKSI